jgi:Zn-dependent protease with chaperone function
LDEDSMTNDEKLNVLRGWLRSKVGCKIKLTTPQNFRDSISWSNNAGARLHTEYSVYHKIERKYKDIILSDELISKSSLTELKVVIGHELGHLKVKGGLKYESNLFRKETNKLRNLSKYNHEREYKADGYACKYFNFEIVGNALCKVFNGDNRDFLEPSDSHPSLEDRLRRLYKERYYAIE